MFSSRRGKGGNERVDRVRSIELGAQIAALAAENRACHRFEEDTLGMPHPISAEHVRAPGPMLPRAPWTIVEYRGELRLHFVEIADRVLVEDNDVCAQPVQPPVLLCLQNLPEHRQTVA